MGRTDEKVLARGRRKERVKKSFKIERGVPRLAVFRSNKHIYAQIINDLEGKTVVSASTLKEEAEKAGVRNNLAGAKWVGKTLATLAKAANIEQVCFDRGGFRYHGRVKALA